MWCVLEARSLSCLSQLPVGNRGEADRNGKLETVREIFKYEAGESSAGMTLESFFEQFGTDPLHVLILTVEAYRLAKCFCLASMMFAFLA